jgi:hypothetical protein
VIPEPTFTLYGLLTSILGGEIVRVPSARAGVRRGGAAQGAERVRRGGHDRVQSQQPHGKPAGPGGGGAPLCGRGRARGGGRGLPRVLRPERRPAPRPPREPGGSPDLLEGHGPGRPARGLPARFPGAGPGGQQGPAPVQPERLLGGRGPRGAGAAAGAGERGSAPAALREELFEALLSLQGVRPYPSRPTSSCSMLDREPKAVFESLFKQGVLVRDVTSHPRLERCLRVSVGASTRTRLPRRPQRRPHRDFRGRGPVTSSAATPRSAAGRARPSIALSPALDAERLLHRHRHGF